MPRDIFKSNKPDVPRQRWNPLNLEIQARRTHGHHYLQTINTIVMINHIMIIISRTITLTAEVFEKGHLSLAALISPWKHACYEKNNPAVLWWCNVTSMTPFQADAKIYGPRGRWRWVSVGQSMVPDWNI